MAIQLYVFVFVLMLRSGSFVFDTTVIEFLVGAYSAPTAIRLLMKKGAEVARKHNLSRLRHLASVGEPLNPEAILWSQEVFPF
jgi:hypothetical protein